MNAITSAWSALANFARALNRLAALTDQVSDQVERRVELAGDRAEVLEHDAGSRRKGPAKV